MTFKGHLNYVSFSVDNINPLLNCAGHTDIPRHLSKHGAMSQRELGFFVNVNTIL